MNRVSASSLRSVPIPRPSGLERYVADERLLVVLGKALFWDVQVSSDSRVACASCHFHAGADHRPQNGMTAATFPFSHSDMTTGRRIASPGIPARWFVDAGKSGSPDESADPSAPAIHAPGVRQMTARNAPSVINAALSFRSFWDGRASNVFTGQTPFGESDPRANVLVDTSGSLTAEAVHIENASLASQAVAPPLDSALATCSG